MGGTKDCEGLQRAAGTIEGNRTSKRFFWGMGSRRGPRGPQGNMVLRRMERGGHGLPKVSPEFFMQKVYYISSPIEKELRTRLIPNPRREAILT
jgi:hypothetical protein